MQLDITTLWKMINDGGLVAAFGLMVLAFIKGWVVPKWAYDAKSKDCDFLWRVAFKGTELAERSTGMAEKLASEHNK